MATPRNPNERHAVSKLTKWTFAIGGMVFALLLFWLVGMPGDSDPRMVTTPPAGNTGQAGAGSDENTGSRIPQPPRTHERSPMQQQGAPSGGAGSDSTRGPSAGGR